MSGLLALLDDVAGIAKVAATSVDDVAAAAGKAGAKTAGVIIDDAAVAPKYVQGFDPARELPIIWRITRGSLFNKLVLLMPVAMLLANFAPWAITPLLMLGGSYLCFEGAEKIYHVFKPHHHDADEPARVRRGAVCRAGLGESELVGGFKDDGLIAKTRAEALKQDRIGTMRPRDKCEATDVIEHHRSCAFKRKAIGLKP